MLFEPIKIGKLELKNRIVMPATGLGYVGRQLKNFYIERAKGGVALIVIGPTAVNKDNPSMVNAYGDQFLPGLKDLADAVHAHGAKIALQLWHPGRYGMMPGKQNVSASDVAPPIFTKSKPKSLTIPEIKEVENEFAEGALRAKKAGFDAVEILAATGYLISQFLSRRTNKRTDEYGGSIENRMRFLLEIVAKIREKVGKDFPIICRISGNEFVEEGNTLEEQKMVAKALEKAGVDAINVNVGWHESNVPQITMCVPRGGFVYLAQGIKEVVKIPVIASHRINDPILAEKILKEGRADMVAMARALIADPELPNKAREGRYDDIRPCLACNQGCFDHILRMKPVSCFMNPVAGREDKCEIKKAEKPKKVWVVGGGPAGMEAALITAMRGHRVTLFEKEKLGGQLNLASVTPGRGELANVAEYFSKQLRKLGVEIRKEEATLEEITKGKPDAVIVATGSTPISNFPGSQRENVVTAHDVLSGRKEVGNRVIIVGGGGIGCETAIFLAEKGKKVTLVEMLGKIGQDIGFSTRWTRLQVIAKKSIKVMTGTKAREIVDGGLRVEVGTDSKEEILKADTIILALGVKPNRSLADALKGKVELHEIGDCKEPQRAMEALHAGFEVGLNI
jgi:2,4-dienoyl-CoA reductase (NADPH2)